MAIEPSRTPRSASLKVHGDRGAGSGLKYLSAESSWASRGVVMRCSLHDSFQCSPCIPDPHSTRNVSMSDDRCPLATLAEQRRPCSALYDTSRWE
eukprot:5613657-Pleurochrysis_carterae.AAC.2